MTKKLESDFEPEFIRELDEAMPGGLFIKGNSAMRQGFPDRLFLHEGHWAAFEVKRDGKASKRPNQEHYIEELNEMSYASFVTPENYKEVVREVQAAFGG